MNVLIVEDNPYFLEGNRKCMEEVSKRHKIPMEIKLFSHVGQELDQYIRENQIDLALLDIEIGEDGNGITVAGEVKKLYPEAVILFASFHDGCLEIPWNINPMRFLSKPVRVEELDKVFLWVLKQIKRYDEKEVRDTFNRITFPCIPSDFDVEVEKLLYVLLKGNEISIIAKNGSGFARLEKSVSIEQLSELLVKVNRTTYVNKREVAEVGKTGVRMSDGEVFKMNLFQRRKIVEKLGQ